MHYNHPAPHVYHYPHAHRTESSEHEKGTAPDPTPAPHYPPEDDDADDIVGAPV